MFFYELSSYRFKSRCRHLSEKLFNSSLEVLSCTINVKNVAEVAQCVTWPLNSETSRALYVSQGSINEKSCSFKFQAENFHNKLRFCFAKFSLVYQRYLSIVSLLFLLTNLWLQKQLRNFLISANFCVYIEFLIHSLFKSLLCFKYPRLKEVVH